MKYYDASTNSYKEIYAKPMGDTLPIGSIVTYPGNIDIPNNWLPAYGGEVSRSEYSELFSIIGTMYGSGDGDSTFNLPYIDTPQVDIIYIIKVYQSSGLLAEISNEYSLSTSNAYSCDYINGIIPSILNNESIGSDKVYSCNYVNNKISRIDAVLSIINEKIEVTLTGVASTSEVTCYYFPFFRMCYIRGSFTNKTISADTATTIGVVPAGYRPPSITPLDLYRANSANPLIYVKINTDGTIQIYSETSMTTGNAVLISGFWLLD